MRPLALSAVLALLLALLAPPARAGDLERQRVDGIPCCPRLEANVFWRAGPVDGFLQTPKGGQRGTTSNRRPTLDELGFCGTSELGLDLTTSWRRHEFAFSGAFLGLGNTERLDRELVSEGSYFPAGTVADSSSWLGTFHFGYRYRFDVPFGRERLVVKPEVGATSIVVHYELDGDTGGSADRDYTHVGPHLGLALAWRPHGTSRFQLTGSVVQTLGFLLPDSNRLDVLDATLRGSWDLTRRWHLFLETGWKRIDWRDDQTVPNHIHVEFGPFVGLGAGYTF